MPIPKRTFLIIVPFIDDGGVEKAVANIANYIREKKDPHEAVYVYALQKGNELGRKFFRDESGLFLGFWDVVKLCSRERKNIILFSALTPANIMGWFLSIVFRIKLFSSQHCVVYNHSPVKWFFLKIIYKIIYARSYRLIAVSEGIRENLIDIIGKKDKIIKLFNPVLASLYMPVIDKKIFPRQKEVHFCVLGRLSKQKGFDIIIKAFHRLSLAGQHNFHLTIAGNGEEASTLKQMVKDYNLENRVTFSGFVSDHKAYYADKDYYLFPSRYEGLGLALIEAMNYGLPVISSDCEYGPSEILENGKHGMLIRDIENVDIWFNVLSDILSSGEIDIHRDYTESLKRFLTPAYVSALENLWSGSNE